MRSRIVALAGCVVVGGAIAAVMTTRNNPKLNLVQKPDVSDMRSAPVPSTQPVTGFVDPEPAATVVVTPTLEPTPQVESAPKTPVQQNAARPAQPIAKQTGRSRKGSPPSAAPADAEAEKPLARQALSLVGADPVAEQIWINSINDPNTSSHDRQDLIEDLNEDGFEDPKNPTSDELPLIENRIALIESLAPDSMDDVNAAAFAEAYKDLINMHARVAGQ